MQQDEVRDESFMNPEALSHPPLSGLKRLELRDLDRRYISLSMELIETVIRNDLQPGREKSHTIKAISQIEQAVEALSECADPSPDLFPKYEDYNNKGLIRKLEESYKKIRNEDKEIQGFLQHQICALKTVEYKVYHEVNGETNGAETKETKQEDIDQGNSIRKTISAPPGLPITTERNSAMDVVGRERTQLARENYAAARNPVYEMREIAYAKAFNARHHYRRDHKCMICAAMKMDKDCFFPLEFQARGRSKDKCTSCRRTKQVCTFTPTTAPSTLPLLPNAASASAPVFTSGNGERNAVSEPVSSPFKPRRTQNPFHMLRQMARLNNSLESFTNVSLRQVDSNRKRHEQETAFKEHRQAYEESKETYFEQKRLYDAQKRAYEESVRDVQEKRRIFKEKQRLHEENESTSAATQEWFATRSEVAGENLIKEANSLLSSIEQGLTLRDIAPALQRLRSVFVDFEHTQSELPEKHKFNGEQSQLLYTLMERICRAVENQVLG